MKRIFILAIASTVFMSCNAQQMITKNTPVDTATYVNLISQETLKKHLTIIASDDMEGRDTGSNGQIKAGEYLIETYKSNGISFPKGATDFYQKVPAAYMNKEYGAKLPNSENIWAFIEGSDKPNEIVVVSAHYDHIGIIDGKVYNGADDDGSGTVALLEIAKAFQIAKNEGHGPKRSILFLHVTGEEHGLHGSRYYTDNPLFPIT